MPFSSVFLLHRQTIPAVNLSPIDQAWLYVICAVSITGLNLIMFRQDHRSRTNQRHPFCQDEKIRLSAEMLRLDS